MYCRNYMGACFEIWNDQHTWYWFVPDPHAKGGIIGAAATEAEALREAHSSIEHISAPQQPALNQAARRE